MLATTQTWLPLLDTEPRTDPAVRRSRRRAPPAAPAFKLGPQDRVTRQAFIGVALSWALTAGEALQLLGEPLSSDAGRLERMQGVLAAHRSLLVIAPEPACYMNLLRQSAPEFRGASLLDVMLQQGLPGIAKVRAHLLARIVG